MRHAVPAPPVPLIEALATRERVVAVELRPPRAELGRRAGMDAWIDTYHAIRTLTRHDTYVFLTDSAVGAQEEDNLRHLVTNLNQDVPRQRIIPFLTTKHSLDYCLSYADRAVEHGFPALVVLGGDASVGPPRCLPHAWELRQRIRERQPAIALGGWANPHREAARQVDFLLARENTAEFYLAQVVSHHHVREVEAFVNEATRRGLTLPGMFGVFYYRSANPRTLIALSNFLPVPAEALVKEFDAGATPDVVCARTVSALYQAGVKHVYISNLPLVGTPAALSRVLRAVRA